MSVRRHVALVSNDSLRVAVPKSNDWASRPVVVSQILMVLSSEPEATSFESLEKATDVTEWLWPVSV